MTDTELITNYIDKNFTISIVNGTFVFIDNTGDIYWPEQFVGFLQKVFGDLEGAEGNLLDIYKKWFENKRAILVKDLHDYLAECDVHLGPASWIVYHNYSSVKYNREVTPMTLTETFGNKYDIRFIEYFFEEWLYEMIYKTSEKIMKIF